MALGRPANKDTQNNVVVHTIGRHRYASTKVFTVGEDGMKRYTHTSIEARSKTGTGSIWGRTTSTLRWRSATGSSFQWPGT